MNEIARFSEGLINLFSRQDTHIVVVTVFLACAALAACFRIFSALHIRGLILRMSASTRKLDIKTREDLKNIKNPLIRKVAAEYVRTAEKAVTRVPTEALVDRQIANLSFLGISYASMMPLVESIESGLLWIGLILAVVSPDFAFVYGVLAVGSFLLAKLMTVFFDFRSAKDLLRDDLFIFIEREISRFFAADTGGAVLRLKNELTEALSKQSATLTAATQNMSNELKESGKLQTAALAEASAKMSESILSALDEKLPALSTNLKEIITEWEQAISESTRMQTATNNATERLDQAASKVQSSAELLSKYLQGHSNALSEQLATLVGAIETLKDVLAEVSKNQNALTQQAKYIDRNQHTLETALTAYEASLQNLTQSLGEGLGAYLNLHGQKAAQAMNDILKTHLEKIRE